MNKLQVIGGGSGRTNLLKKILLYLPYATNQLRPFWKPAKFAVLGDALSFSILYCWLSKPNANIGKMMSVQKIIPAFPGAKL